MSSSPARHQDTASDPARARQGLPHARTNRQHTWGAEHPSMVKIGYALIGYALGCQKMIIRIGVA
jgi:hypothetical protein